MSDCRWADLKRRLVDDFGSPNLTTDLLHARADAWAAYIERKEEGDTSCASLRALNKRLVEMLRRRGEYDMTDPISFDRYCFYCRHWEASGHSPDCELAKLLEEAKG